jgi:WD40 repeat protein
VVTAVALSADGRLAVSASWDKTLKVWDVVSGRELHTLAGHTKGINAIVLTADGRLAVSASDDHTVKV